MFAFLKNPHNQDLLMKTIRQVLPGLGGLIVGLGYASEAKWVMASGVLLNGLNFLWMVINNTAAAQAAKVDSIPGVKAVVLDNSAAGKAIAATTTSPTVNPVEKNPGV